LDISINKQVDSQSYQSVIDVLDKTSVSTDEEIATIGKSNYFDRYGHVWYPIGRLHTRDIMSTKENSESNSTNNITKRPIFLPTSDTTIDVTKNVIESTSATKKVTPKPTPSAPYVPTETIVAIPPKLSKVSSKR
jgi:hypothetical protein